MLEMVYNTNFIHFQVLICSANDVALSVLDAIPLFTSLLPKYNNFNDGLRKLAILIDGVSEIDMSVVFTPISDDASALKFVDVKPLNEWRTNVN